MKMGEASLLIAKKINEKASPNNRGEEDLKVTYLIFPGTAEKTPGPPNLDKWYEKVSEYLTELGGLGAGYSVYKWEEQFPKAPPDDSTLLAQGNPPKPDDPATDPSKTPAAASANPDGAKKNDPASPAAAAPETNHPKTAAENGKAASKNGAHAKKKTS
jgi:hypothetical protein